MGKTVLLKAAGLNGCTTGMGRVSVSENAESLGTFW